MSSGSEVSDPDRRLPIEYLFSWIGWNSVGISIAAGLALYLGGLIAATTIDLADVYISTQPMYMTAIGVTWSLIGSSWASRAILRIIPDLRPAFSTSDQQFKSFTKRWLDRLCDWRFPVIVSSIGISAWIIFVTQFLANNVRLDDPWPGTWTQSGSEDLWLKLTIIGVQGAVVIAIMMTNIVSIGFFFLFIRKLFTQPTTRLSINPVLVQARESLRPIVNFGIVSGLVWSVGVSLFVIMFRPHFESEKLAIPVISLLTLVAALLILWPQWAVHLALARVKSCLHVKASERVDLAIGLDPEQRNDHDSVIDKMMSSPHESAMKFIDSLDEQTTFIHGPENVAIVITTLVLPFGTLILSNPNLG